MNTSMIHSSGALVLDITDLRLMDRNQASAGSNIASAPDAQSDDLTGGDQGGGYGSPGGPVPMTVANDDDDDDDHAGHSGHLPAGAGVGNDATGRWSLGTSRRRDGSVILLKPSSSWNIGQVRDAILRVCDGAGSGIILDSDMGRMSTGLNEVRPGHRRELATLVGSWRLNTVYARSGGAPFGPELDRLCRPVGDAGPSCRRRARRASVPERSPRRPRPRRRIHRHRQLSDGCNRSPC